MILYYLVFPAKYREVVLDKEIDQELRNVYLEIEARYQMKFLDIGMDKEVSMKCSGAGGDIVLSSCSIQ